MKTTITEICIKTGKILLKQEVELSGSGERLLFIEQDKKACAIIRMVGDDGAITSMKMLKIIQGGIESTLAKES